MQYLVASSREGKPPYTVDIQGDGRRCTCTCAHFTYRLRNSGTHCKHIDQVLAHLKKQDALQREADKLYEVGLGSDWLEASKEDE